MAIAIGSQEEQFFPVHGVNTALPSIFKCGIMLVLKERCFCMIICTADSIRVPDT